MLQKILLMMLLTVVGSGCASGFDVLMNPTEKGGYSLTTTGKSPADLDVRYVKNQEGESFTVSRDNRLNLIDDVNLSAISLGSGVNASND